MFRGLATAVLLMGIASSPAPAQTSQYVLSVGGSQLQCQSWRGERVPIRFNHSLPQVGRAYRSSDGRPVIEINPGILNQFSSPVARWWFAHECAHHELPPVANSEKQADCRAARKLRSAGLLQSADLDHFHRELRFVPASAMGHLPGPDRAEHVRKCFGATQQFAQSGRSNAQEAKPAPLPKIERQAP